MQSVIEINTGICETVQQAKDDLTGKLEIVEQMMAKSPDDRPNSPRTVAEMLADWSGPANLTKLLDGDAPLVIDGPERVRLRRGRARFDVAPGPCDRSVATRIAECDAGPSGARAPDGAACRRVRGETRRGTLR